MFRAGNKKVKLRGCTVKASLKPSRHSHTLLIRILKQGYTPGMSLQYILLLGSRTFALFYRPSLHAAKPINQWLYPSAMAFYLGSAYNIRESSLRRKGLDQIVQTTIARMRKAEHKGEVAKEIRGLNWNSVDDKSPPLQLNHVQKKRQLKSWALTNLPFQGISKH